MVRRLGAAVLAIGAGLVPACASPCSAQQARADILTMRPQLETAAIEAICIGEQRCFLAPFDGVVDDEHGYLVTFPDRTWLAVAPESLPTGPVTVIVRLTDGRALTGRAAAAHRADRCTKDRRQEVTLA